MPVYEARLLILNSKSTMKENERISGRDRNKYIIAKRAICIQNNNSQSGKIQTLRLMQNNGRTCKETG